MWDDVEEERASLLRAQEELVSEGLLEAVPADDSASVRFWQDCDLASMVEGAYRRQLDPRVLSPDERGRWREQFGEDYETPRIPERHDFSRRYFLLDDVRRVGTVSLGLRCTGPATVPLSSLYVLPDHRGGGVASRTLQSFHDAVVRNGARGIRLDTYWTWQRSLRFYLKRRMWLYMWKRDLGLVWAQHLPAYDLALTGEEGRFRVLQDGCWIDLLRAAPAGERLVLEELPAYLHLLESGVSAAICALATLSAWLAVHGWPLIRSQEEWARRHGGCDIGGPEAFAERIRLYEALARRSGWAVETPRIPGLTYPSYEELCAEDK
jgi:GNAT superfamily N-acetyltransferase